MQPIVRRSVGRAERSATLFAAVTSAFALRSDVERVADNIAFSKLPF